MSERDPGELGEPEPPPEDGPELDPASANDDDVETDEEPAVDTMVPPDE